ncbi:hypothetical protein [Streptomyces lushanensis]|uniref:hypothetical protein n=1 Tax=Streptomyces lushanensis TaxID=1434255 RepID=UPI000831404A|nr:hypothetical protein [Streptomyces lushanensis]
MCARHHSRAHRQVDKAGNVSGGSADQLVNTVDKTPPADADVAGCRVWQGVMDPDSGETVWKENCWTGSSVPGRH